MSGAEFIVLAVVATVMILAIRGARLAKQATPRRREAPDEESLREPGFEPLNEPDRREPERASSSAFRFSPELFEYRSRVIERLDSEGYSWFSHYSAVDCLHDVHGIEVCGIREGSNAKAILRILARMFPDWTPG